MIQHEWKICAQGNLVTLSSSLFSSKQIQHSRLFSSTRSSGATLIVGSFLIAFCDAGGARPLGVDGDGDGGGDGGCCSCCGTLLDAGGGRG
jgi:hypothetical protein